MKYKLINPLVLVAIALFITAPTVVSGAENGAQTHHIHLAASNASEAVKWYVRHLACKPIEERPDAIDCGGFEIEFVVRATLGGSPGTGVNHIGFSFADVTAKMAELEAVGVRGSGVRLQRFEDGSTLREIPGLIKHGFIFDPWGTRIELVEDLEILGFHHIHLHSADPGAALQWYSDIFGGKPAKLKDQQDGLLLGRVWLLVSAHPQGRPAPTDERSVDHVGFVVADLDAAAAQMTAKGVELRGPTVPANGRSTAKRAFLSGPDGVMIAVVETGWAGIIPAKLLAEESSTSNEPFTTPRTPWGEPDLQGIWTGNAAHGIPLERTAEATENEALTPEEAAARRERGTLGSIWGYEREWRDTTLDYAKLAPSRQVAMVIDPPDGRLPALTEKGEAWAAAARDARAYRRLAAGPEDLSTYVRCITRGLPGLMMPGIYNNGLQIIQSPGYVAIEKEMIHETRIIPTKTNPHLGSNLKQWLGNSRGRWEGDTLVVEVTGFNGRASYRGSDENLKLTERYRLVGPHTLEYTFTIDDPTVWTSPWTGMFHFEKDDAQYELVEYACHEGNYGMTNILSGARAKEKLMKGPAG
ncbi:MAG: VOC family protein [Gammaproteobacteria bacterium]|nr:VOC family protein [Gammaproteobacteria bacterium]